MTRRVKERVWENFKYVVFGVIAAYLLNFGFGLALGTEMPIVAVVSSSMTHDSSIPRVHYEFLENELGYSEEEIDSWPVGNGFTMGSVLVVKGISGDELKVGDVIVYKIDSQKTPIVHRIIEFNGEEMTTKGDHNPAVDPWKPNEILGKVVLKIPYLGWPKLLLSRLL